MVVKTMKPVQNISLKRSQNRIWLKGLTDWMESHFNLNEVEMPLSFPSFTQVFCRDRFQIIYSFIEPSKTLNAKDG